ncbi:MAG: hypothetical protein ACI4BA_03075 [Prevotella sp.]
MKKQLIAFRLILIFLLGITSFVVTANAQNLSADRVQVKFEDESAAAAIMALRADIAFERIIPEASNELLTTSWLMPERRRKVR